MMKVIEIKTVRERKSLTMNRNKNKGKTSKSNDAGDENDRYQKQKTNNQQRKRNNKIQQKEIQKARREKTIHQLKLLQQKCKKANKTKKVHKYNDDMEYWGDTLQTSHQWPQYNENNIIRIMGQNVHGISHYNDYVEWNMIMSYLDEFQVDVGCMCEPNLDLNNHEVKNVLYSRLKKIDPYAKLTMSASKSKYNESHFKMGGNLMYSRSTCAGLICKQGVDKLDRWGY